jgi:hypothetical protein
MINFIRNFFVPSNKDYLENPNAFALAEKILELQERITILELENIEMTNALYECENRIEAKIDNIHPVIYNIEDKKLDSFTLGDK